MTSSAPAVKAGLYSVLGILYDGVTSPSGSPVLVSYGDPGIYQPDAIVAVMGISDGDNARPTSGPGRRIEETLAVTVVVSVFVPGDNTVQRAATEAAYDLYSRLVARFQTSPNETLGGACREAAVTRHRLTESKAVHPDSGAVTGRIAEIDATVTTKARI